MEFKTIIYSKKEGIATITLNRPEKLNTMTEEFLIEFNQTLDLADADEEVRVIVITGAGDRAFCAGDDVNMFPGFDMQRGRRFVRKSMTTLLRLQELDKPTIAAVNGCALGGGFELALCCDITVASAEATFGCPEPRFGLAAAIAVHRLQQAIGTKRARELLLTANTITAQEAERIGLVNKVVPGSQLWSAALEMAGKIKDLAPLAVTMTKESLNWMTADHREIDYAVESTALLYATEDCKEGVRSFRERRRPVFKGR